MEVFWGCFLGYLTVSTVSGRVFGIFQDILVLVLVPGGEGAVGKGEMPVQELVFGGVVEADPIVQVQLPLRRALNKIYLFYK